MGRLEGHLAQQRAFATDVPDDQNGTGQLAYLMGGGVNGGQVYRDWPGLDDVSLYNGEDLDITTDLRTVITEMLNKRLGGTDVNTVFPGFSYPGDLNLFL